MENLSDPRFWVLMAFFLVWIHRAWRALRTLQLAPIVHPTTSVQETDAPLVSVIIPAKNEEQNIAACIDHFLAQKGAHFEIIVANDNSTDRTREILDSYGNKIQTLDVPPTPEGWTGKNFAIHSALGLANGSWYLFTDADTRHAPESIASSLSHAQSKDLEFLTLLPKCLAESFVEKMIQPLAMCFLGLWFPIEKINDPKNALYFANGQYILMSRPLYKKIKGHANVKGAFLEDFAMMKNAQNLGSRIECAFGMNIYGTRMYDSFDSLWRGWRRIYLHAFNQKAAPLMNRFLSLVFFSIVPFTCFFALILSPASLAQDGFLLGALAVLLIFILAISWRAYAMVQSPKRYALLHPLSALVIAMVLLDAFWMAMTKKRTVWR